MISTAKSKARREYLARRRSRLGNGWRLSVAAAALFCILNCALTTVRAQKAPEGLFLEDEEEELPKFYELGIYPKARTQFDGVTHDLKVNYLKMTRETGVEIPVLSTGKGATGEALDFTVMLWFKVSEEVFTARDTEIMYLFSFDESVACFLTKTMSIMCDSHDRSKLQIEGDMIDPGKWFHLTLSVSKAGSKSYLLLQDNSRGEIGFDSLTQDGTSFTFQQDRAYGWSACFGDCQSNFGLEGGIREIVLRNCFIEKDEVLKAKNLQFTYAADFKAYFRLQDIEGRFDRDEFVDRPWRSLKPAGMEREDYIGIDVIPNDVCPASFHQKKYIEFGLNDPPFDTIEMQNNLTQEEYVYFFSTTLMVTGTTCTTKSPTKAASDCNVFLIDEVFMLYFEQINMAKFHFFAAKNYYESATKAFFVPHDQWVTIQLKLSHYLGWQVVVADQNGHVFYEQSRHSNMQRMRPRNTMSLLNNFSGLVDHLLLCGYDIDIQTPRVRILKDRDDCLLNLQFAEAFIETEGEGRKKYQVLANKGSEDVLRLPEKVHFRNKFFQKRDSKPSFAGSLKAEESFDGIACDDGHMTLKLDGPESYVRFTTPERQMWQSESAIEFWFKLDDKSDYNAQEKTYIFSMRDKDGRYPYYEIFIQDGMLHCAPFGQASLNDPLISFSDFKEANEDTFGWWHVVCSYSFQKQIKGWVYNTKVSGYETLSLVGSSSYYPMDSLVGTFGNPQKTQSDQEKGAKELLIKEVRYWGQQLHSSQVSDWRYRQLDPFLQAFQGRLLTYLRLAAGTFDLENFAAINPANNLPATEFKTSGISFVEEFLETESFYYDVVSAKVLSQVERTYHTVCPLHTYYLDKYCYSEPINKLLLAIFPFWNDSTDSLDWELSVLNSSTIDDSALTSLRIKWESSDDVLNNLLDASYDTYKFIVPTKYLRHESEYKIGVTLFNEQKTVYTKETVHFVPSKCTWFDVVGSDVKNTYEELLVSPGTADITFTLRKKSDRNLDCENFNFFNKVDRIDFDFLLTNTVEYIVVPPIVEYLDKGDSIEVTIPAIEQTKLPVFRDIVIVLTIRFTTTNYSPSTPQPESENSEDISNELVFQNVLYTIKFEPRDNSLVANLIASSNEVIRGETLILDASSSYISNMPANMRSRGLTFEWQCPEVFKDFCLGQNASQLQIPFSVVRDIELNLLAQGESVFLTEQEFTAVISWNKPDTDLVVDKLTEVVIFYDLTKPNFDLVYSPDPILITDVKNTVFSLTNANFNINDLRNYDVEWTLEPDLLDDSQRTVLQYGKIMQVVKGAFDPNTEYTVTVTATHKALEKLTETKSLSFQTKAPPTPGTVQVQPSKGYIGTEFNVILRGWTSDNSPITYQVYETEDINGARRGRLLTRDSPVPFTEQFQYVAANTFPIQVIVSDASGESVLYKMAPEISTDSQPDIQIENPATMLMMIKKSDALTEKVSLMNSVMSKSLEDTETLVSEGEPSQLGSNSQTKQKATMQPRMDLEQQIKVRKALLAEIDGEIDVYHNQSRTRVIKQDMSAEDYLRVTIPIMRDITTVPDFLDEETALKAEIVSDRLREIQPGLFDKSIQEDEILRSNYLTILENLNLFSRQSQSAVTQSWVLDRLGQLMDEMCSYQNLEKHFKSRESTEIEFQLYRFDQSTAMLNKRAVMKVLDGQYNFEAYESFNWFPTTRMPGELCAQVSAVNGFVSQSSSTRRLALPSTTAYSDSIMQVALYEKGTNYRHSMGELTGQSIVRFDVDPDTYRQNQTKCMGFSTESASWEPNLCISQLISESLQMKCTCNAFKSTYTSLFMDYTEEWDASVEIEWPQKISSLDGKRSGRSENILASIKTQMKGNSYVWLTTSILLAILLLAGSAIAIRVDRKDAADNMAETIQSTHPRVNMQGSQPVNHFILEIARELHQPYSEVEFRKQSLFTYRNICTKSVFLHAIAQMHPLLAPFMSYFATQSRIFRFSAYVLQINILSVVLSYHFHHSVYRYEDIRLDESVIDQTDTRNILIASALGSLALLPILSEPLCTLFSNKVARVQSNEIKYMDDIQVAVVQRRVCPRYFLVILANLTTFAVPFWALLDTWVMPASNQYCIFTSILGSIIGSLFVTSVLYVAYNSCIAQSMVKGKAGRGGFSNILVCHKALRIAYDLKAVQEASKLFTLADVLPASLENSEREIQQQVQIVRVSTANNLQSHPDQNEIALDELLQEEDTDKEQEDEINADSSSKDPNVEDSLQSDSLHNVQAPRKGMSTKVSSHKSNTKKKWDDLNADSLTYTDYKNKLGVKDSSTPVKSTSRLHQSHASRNNNNYMRTADNVSQSGETNGTHACNQQERDSMQESSQAEFLNGNRGSQLHDEISQCISQNISQNVSKLDVSRNEIIPIRGIGSSSSGMQSVAQSDFSDIRGEPNQESVYSSLHNAEARVQHEGNRQVNQTPKGFALRKVNY